MHEPGGDWPEDWPVCPNLPTCKTQERCDPRPWLPAVSHLGAAKREIARRWLCHVYEQVLSDLLDWAALGEAGESRRAEQYRDDRCPECFESYEECVCAAGW